jgi:enoyl-CoA hydratase/carnithine racemase
VLRADLVGPEEALHLGLLDELAAPEAVLDRSLEVAGELAALPRSAYPRVKRQLRGDTISAIERVLDDEGDPLLGRWLAEDAAGAAAGVLEGPQERRARKSK